jgi:sialate O-acetylesterase
VTRLAKCLLLAAVAGAAPAARADVKPHALFSDHAVLQRDAELKVWGTADPGEKVTVTLAGGDGPAAVAEAAADDTGAWAVTLPKQPAGTGRTLTLKGKNAVTLSDVAVGDVWVCSGQSNMEWRFAQLRGGKELAAKAATPGVKLFTVPRHAAAEPQAGFKKGQDWEARWLESTPETVYTFSAVAAYFGRDVQKAVNVPVGLIHTSWGGTPAEAWTSREALAAADELKHYVGRREQMVAAGGRQGLNPNTPASLYNGMIHPLLPFAVKGAIWYQGESNAGRAAEYRTLFTTMIADWRKLWRAELPFLCVQLAPYHAGDADGVSWAELREAQFLATRKLPAVGIAVITDVGELFDIHPQQKEPVGQRLALAARGIAYGQRVEYRGPEYKGLTVEGDKAVLAFDFAGGLTAKGGVLNGFEVCGEDREFYPAKAAVKGDAVVVSSPKVSKPVAVRYGWSNFPVCNLFNKAGLPASPFRTDDFPLTTAAKR